MQGKEQKRSVRSLKHSVYLGNKEIDTFLYKKIVGAMDAANYKYRCDQSHLPPP